MSEPLDEDRWRLSREVFFLFTPQMSISPNLTFGTFRDGREQFKQVKTAIWNKKRLKRNILKNLGLCDKMSTPATWQEVFP